MLWRAGVPRAGLQQNRAPASVQAFSRGNALALQFHPEHDPERIEQWLIGNLVELTGHGIDIPALRERTREVADEAVMAGIALLREHLKTV